jgi:hypothetical protein
MAGERPQQHPAFYVIRKARTEASPPFASEEEQRIYQTALSGPAYSRDRQKVFEILTQLLSGTPAWTWISSHETTKNGRAAFEALRKHYDGPGQVEKRLAYAYNIVNTTHYRSERQYSFENYVTKLSEAFEILKDNDVAKPEREKVDCLLNGMQSENQIIVTAKTTVRMNMAMRTSFQVAGDHLSELMLCMILWLAISAMVSVATQKYGGLSTHPMGRTRGNATSGVPSGAGGKATPRAGMW